MPEERTKRRAAKDKAEGKAPSTQAGEFVREEIEHVREGKHGARSTQTSDRHRALQSTPAGVALASTEARQHFQAHPPKCRPRQRARSEQVDAKNRPHAAAAPRARRWSANRAPQQHRPHFLAKRTLPRVAAARARARQLHARPPALAPATKQRRQALTPQPGRRDRGQGPRVAPPRVAPRASAGATAWQVPHCARAAKARFQQSDCARACRRQVPICRRRGHALQAAPSDRTANPRARAGRDFARG